ELCVAIRVECPCGRRLSSWEDNIPFLADFLPEQHSDAYCDGIERAIREHPGSPEIATAFAIDSTVSLFRQIWQCPACGRLLILGPDGKHHAFLPEQSGTPRDVLAGKNAT